MKTEKRIIELIDRKIEHNREIFDLLITCEKKEFVEKFIKQLEKLKEEILNEEGSKK